MTKEQHSKTNVYGLGMASIILATSIVAVGHTGNASASEQVKERAYTTDNTHHNILQYGEHGHGPAYLYENNGYQGDTVHPPGESGEAPAPKVLDNDAPKVEQKPNDSFELPQENRTWYQKLWDYIKKVIQNIGGKLGI